MDTDSRNTEPRTMRFWIDLISVDHPERWWTATRRQLVDQTDPDVDDGAQRHADRDEIRWHLVAAILSQVSAKLDARDYRDSKELPHTANVDVDSPPDGYTPAETAIITSWFTREEFPRADAWQTVSGNGRHRLYNVWLHRSDAPLPVRSHLLDFLDDIDSEHLAATIREQAAAGLARLPTIVRERSPHYAAQLRLATEATVASHREN